VNVTLDDVYETARRLGERAYRDHEAQRELLAVRAAAKAERLDWDDIVAACARGRRDARGA
jgi:hypothetical protein